MGPMPNAVDSRELALAVPSGIEALDYRLIHTQRPRKPVSQPNGAEGVSMRDRR
jgi:hypothetical protein